MSMIWIIIAAVALIMLAVDWFIVMGMNPRKWKGGKDNEQRKIR